MRFFVSTGKDHYQESDGSELKPIDYPYYGVTSE